MQSLVEREYNQRCTITVILVSTGKREITLTGTTGVMRVPTFGWCELPHTGDSSNESFRELTNILHKVAYLRAV